MGIRLWRLPQRNKASAHQHLCSNILYIMFVSLCITQYVKRDGERDIYIYTYTYTYIYTPVNHAGAVQYQKQRVHHASIERSAALS